MEQVKSGKHSHHHPARRRTRALPNHADRVLSHGRPSAPNRMPLSDDRLLATTWHITKTRRSILTRMHGACQTFGCVRENGSRGSGRPLRKSIDGDAVGVVAAGLIETWRAADASYAESNSRPSLGARGSEILLKMTVRRRTPNRILGLAADFRRSHK